MSVDFAKEKTTARERLKNTLSDLKWHSWAELSRTSGIRYSARILELKRLGFKIESQGNRVEGKAYRLLSKKPGQRRGKKVKIFLEEDDAQAVLDLTKIHLNLHVYIAVADALESFRANKGKL